MSDLRSGSFTGGSGEEALVSAAAVQMINFYGLPVSVGAGMTDSKLPDYQAGYEKALAIALDGKGAATVTGSFKGKATFGTAYHLTFPLNPGAYNLEVVGAAGGAPQVLWADEVVIPPTATEGTWTWSSGTAVSPCAARRSRLTMPPPTTF